MCPVLWRGSRGCSLTATHSQTMSAHVVPAGGFTAIPSFLSGASINPISQMRKLRLKMGGLSKDPLCITPRPLLLESSGPSLPPLGLGSTKCLPLRSTPNGVGPSSSSPAGWPARGQPSVLSEAPRGQWPGRWGRRGRGCPLPAALCLPACAPRAPREAGRRLSQASSSLSCANWVSS